MDQASQVAALTDLTIHSGDDSIDAAADVDRRPRRESASSANIVPQDMQALIKAWNDGDTAGAIQVAS